MKKNEILNITICSIMAAVSIILEKFVSLDLGMGIKLTFYGLPLMIVGIMFGVKLGLLTGIVTGAIIQLTSPYGISVTSIFWALAPIVWGTLSAIMYLVFKKSNNFIVLVCVVLTTSLSATIVNTLAMILEGIIFADEYYAFANVIANVPIRFLSMVILVIPYALLLKSIIRIKFVKND